MDVLFQGGIIVQKSIKSVFIAGIVLVSIVLLGILTFVNIRQLSSNMEEGIYNTLESKAAYEAKKFDYRLAQVAGKTEGLGRLMSSMPGRDIDLAYSYINQIVASDPIICGSGLWYAADAVPERGKWFGPYFFEDASHAISMTMEYSNEAYNYPQYTWYKEGIKGEQKVFWDEPSYDEVTKTSMMTSSYPIIHNGKVEGVLTVDIGLAELENYVRSIKIGENGYAFVVTQSGQMIAYHDDAMNMKDKLQESSNPDLAALGSKIQAVSDADSSFAVESSALGDDSYIVAAPIGTTGLKLVMAAPVSDYNGAIHQAIAVSVGLSLVVIVLLCAAIMYIFNRRVDAPIRRIMNSAQEMAKGNLAVNITAENDDEIGVLSHSIAEVGEGIRSIITEVSNMAQQVSAASEELYATADQSAQSLHKISDTVNVVMTDARRQEGQAIDSVSSMKNIGRQIGEAQEAIIALGEHSTEISQIVDTISSIASQTNLLALNAAIEAARAGEQGRGFAVVAEEVRKLAEQSQEAAERVAELIHTSTVYTDKAVKGMSSSAAEVEKGTETINTTGKLFDNLVQHIRQVSDGMQDVSRQMAEIASGNEEVIATSEELKNIAVKTADETDAISTAVNTQQSSQADVTAASQSLAELAQDLQKVIGRFKF